MNIGAYIGLFNISIKNKIAYFKDYALSTFSRILTYVFIIFVWNIIYAGEHVSNIAGFNLIQINAYFVIGGALFILINSENDRIVSDDIESGTISSKLIKPINYVSAVFIESFTDNIIVLPPVLIGVFLAIYYIGVHPTLISIFTFLIIFVIGYLILNIFQFMVGSLAIYTTSAFGISILSLNIIEIFGGSIMPLTFFPNYISNILSILPFQMFFYVPTTILIGKMPSSEYLYYILLGFIWLLIFGVIGYLLWSHVKKKISTAGG